MLHLFAMNAENRTLLEQGFLSHGLRVLCAPYLSWPRAVSPIAIGLADIANPLGVAALTFRWPK